MASTYKPVGRKTNLIGSNIRKGLTPGGFMATLTRGSPRVRTPHASKKSNEVREAANRVLESAALSTSRI